MLQIMTLFTPNSHYSQNVEDISRYWVGYPNIDNVPNYREYTQISGIHFVTLPWALSADSFDPKYMITYFHTVTGAYSSSPNCLIVYFYYRRGESWLIQYSDRPQYPFRTLSRSTSNFLPKIIQIDIPHI